MRRLACLLALLCLLPAAPAWANAAPPRWVGDPPAVLLPGDDTRVRVASEVLTFDLADDLASARVSAVYHLRNDAAAPADAQFAFVLAGDAARADAAVMVDGAPARVRTLTDTQQYRALVYDWLAAHPAVATEARRLAASDATAEQAGELLARLAASGVQASPAQALALVEAVAQPDTAEVGAAARLLEPERSAAVISGWTSEPVHTLLNPVSGGSEQRQFYGNDGGELSWLLFGAEIPAGGERVVAVAYTQRAAQDRATLANTIYQYDYLLSPARHWAGYGTLDLAVNLPRGAYFASTLPLQQAGNTYRAHLDGLPDHELTFSVMPTRGIVLGLTDGDSYLLLVAVSTALLGLLLGGGLGWLLGPARFGVRRWLLALIVFGMACGVLLLIAALLLGALWPVESLTRGYGLLLTAPAAAIVATPLALASLAVAKILRGRRRRVPPAETPG